MAYSTLSLALADGGVICYDSNAQNGMDAELDQFYGWFIFNVKT